MNIIGVQRKVFYFGFGVTAYALYDLFLDIRFADKSGRVVQKGDLILSSKVKVTDVKEYKNKDVVMIDPLSGQHSIATVQGIPQEMVNLNQNLSFMVPNGQFYSNSTYEVEKKERLIDLTGFHFLALIKAYPQIRIWPNFGLLEGSTLQNLLSQKK